MSALELRGISVTRRGRAVLADVSVSVAPGEVVGLIGPNGAGKTTLLRAALGLLPAAGQSNLADLPPRERARAAAWLPQAREIAWPVDVETLVALGRMPWRPRGAPLAEADRTAVERALAWMDLVPLRGRAASRLSGGEQARVLIARALAQEAPLLLADEPIAGLDPAHQLATMRVFRDLGGQGRAVVTALHDLGLAARYCSRLVLVSAGRIVADGPPEAVLSEANVAQVFGVRGRFGAGGFIVEEAV